MDEKPAPTIEFNRAEDFESLYANNVHFESSIWDFKMLFGELDQSKGGGNAVIRQHTAMTVPWLQVKLLAYFLAVNLALHQSNNGNILVPAGVLPTRPDPTSPDLTDDKAKNVCAYLAWIYDQFFGSDPYIPPGVDPTKL